MSIYSGFGTRSQETHYNKAIYNLLYLMQLKISRNNKSGELLFYFAVPFDELKFSTVFTKLYNRLYNMDEQKYLPPKFSYALKELASDYGVYERADVSSIISGETTNSLLTVTSGFNKSFS